MGEQEKKNKGGIREKESIREKGEKGGGGEGILLGKNWRNFLSCIRRSWIRGGSLPIRRG